MSIALRVLTSLFMLAFVLSGAARAQEARFAHPGVQADAKRSGFMPKVVATSNGSYSDQTWLNAQKAVDLHEALGHLRRLPKPLLAAG